MNPTTKELPKESIEAISASLGSEQAFITAVIAPTGTGKSTTMVEKLNDMGCTIFVLQPTIMGVNGLYKYMSEKHGTKKVGKAAESEATYTNVMLSKIRGNRYSDTVNTPIVYATSGHMKRIFLDLVAYCFANSKRGPDGVPSFSGIDCQFCDILMIDEIHAGSIDNDVVMATYNTLRKYGVNLPRLLCASATLHADDIPFPPSEVMTIEIPVVSYPVEVIYHKKSYKPTDDSLYKDTAGVIVAIHNAQKPIPEGSTWLVFCPGAAEVETIKGLLSEVKDIEAIGIYGAAGSEENARIFTPVPTGKRRVIAATNIAEASITIDGVSGVFDTLTEKYGETSSTGGFRLGTHSISKSSADQRKGRTGRQLPGFCYRMITESQYKILPNTRPTEISRVPLHSVCLELMNVGLDPSHIFPKLREDMDRINSSVSLLRELGMFESDPFRVNDKGKFATLFPYSVRGSALLYDWIHARKPDGEKYPVFPGLAMVNMIESYGPSYFWLPHRSSVTGDYDEVIRERFDKYYTKYDGENDFVVLGNLMNDMLVHFQTITPTRRDIGDYAASNGLNNKKLIELFRNLYDAYKECSRIFGKINVGGFNPHNVLKAIHPLMLNVYKDSIFKAQGSGRGNPMYTNDGKYYRLDKHAVLKSSLPTYSSIISIITFESRGVSITRSITFSVPADISEMVEIEPIRRPQQLDAAPSGKVRLMEVDGRIITLPSLDPRSSKPKTQPKISTGFYILEEIPLLPSIKEAFPPREEGRDEDPAELIDSNSIYNEEDEPSK